MSKKTKRIVLGASLTVAALGLVWFATGSVLAGGMGQGGFMGHFANSGFHCQVSQLIEQLQLDAEQQARLDAVHALIAQQHAECAPQHEQHLQELLTGIEQGNLDAAEINAAIETHAAEFTRLATAVSNELVALVNSLDPDQRTILLEHLQAAQEKAAGCQGHKLLGQLHGKG